MSKSLIRAICRTGSRLGAVAPFIPPHRLALWLYATSEGVSSARALKRLCESHDAYRWLCGGVSVNHHTLADFWIGYADLLDRLLCEHRAALAKAGLVNLETLAQDGERVGANAGASSFRREATLDKHLEQAEAAARIIRFVGCQQVLHQSSGNSARKPRQASRVT